MSRFLTDGSFLLEPELPSKCEMCGKIAELRPYGPNGMNVCFECGMKDEKNLEEQFLKRLGNPSKILLKRLDL